MFCFDEVYAAGVAKFRTSTDGINWGLCKKYKPFHRCCKFYCFQRIDCFTYERPILSTWSCYSWLIIGDLKVRKFVSTEVIALYSDDMARSSSTIRQLHY